MRLVNSKKSNDNSRKILKSSTPPGKCPQPMIRKYVPEQELIQDKSRTTDIKSDFKINDSPTEGLFTSEILKST